MANSNAVIVEIGTQKVLFSYHTPVVVYDCETNVYSVTSKWHSTTTSKHINKFIKLIEKAHAGATRGDDLTQEQLDCEYSSTTVWFLRDNLSNL